MNLAEFRERNEKRPVVRRLRETHHMMARLFACGLKGNEVARRMGYSANRVSMIRGDPAFQDLIRKYEVDLVDAGVRAGVETFAELAVFNKVAAERMIADRLEAAQEAADEAGTVDELPTLRTLAAIVADRADRFGYPKGHVQTNLNFDYAARLDQAVRHRRVPRVDSRPSSPPLLAPSPREVVGPSDFVRREF